MNLRILTAAILIPASLAAVFYSPFRPFLILTDLLILLAVWEFNRISRRLDIVVFPATYLMAAGFPWIWFYLPDQLAALLLLFFLLTLLWTVFTVRGLSTGLSLTSVNLFVPTYIALPLTLIAGFQKHAPRSYEGSAPTMELLLVLVIIWISDSAAYWIGSLAGKHKLTPRISPKKSLEGFLAGIAAPVLIAPWFARLTAIEFPWYVVAGIALVVASTGIIGDLFESILKRGAGVKDSSSLIPGHGGILDRIDSLLTAFPAYYLLTVILR